VVRRSDEPDQEVKHLTSFIRSSTWITPEFAAEFAPEGRTAFFSERQKDEWLHDKDKFLDHRKKVESTMNRFFDLQYKDSDLQKDALENFPKTMRARLSRKPEIADLLGKRRSCCTETRCLIP
jgi:cation diffusion facilitator CzcD-associated flavoprotein CzcO